MLEQNSFTGGMLPLLSSNEQLKANLIHSKADIIHVIICFHALFEITCRTEHNSFHITKMLDLRVCLLYR